MSLHPSENATSPGAGLPRQTETPPHPWTALRHGAVRSPLCGAQLAAAPCPSFTPAQPSSPPVLPPPDPPAQTQSLKILGVCARLRGESGRAGGERSLLPLSELFLSVLVDLGQFGDVVLQLFLAYKKKAAREPSYAAKRDRSACRTEKAEVESPGRQPRHPVAIPSTTSIEYTPGDGVCAPVRNRLQNKTDRTNWPHIS